MMDLKDLINNKQLYISLDIQHIIEKDVTDLQVFIIYKFLIKTGIEIIDESHETMNLRMCK